MAGIIILGAPLLSGLVGLAVGAAADSVILAVNSIPTLPALGILHLAICLPFFMCSAYKMRQTILGLEGSAELSDYGFPLPGTVGAFFFGATILTGLVALAIVIL